MALHDPNNTILLTGGGSGIGRALAHRLHDLGNTVIITGRRLDTLQDSVGGRERLFAKPLDIDDPAAIARFVQDVVAEHPQLNVLVNNAGIMRHDDLSRASGMDDAVAQVTTNLLGPIRLTNALLEHLKRQPDPVIMNVSSGLAFVPLAEAGIYSATKAAVHAYTLALRHRLQGKATVIELIPPAVQTDLTPGQSTRAGYLPLEAYIDEVMALLATRPVADEIVVERARLLVDAAKNGNFHAVFTGLNGTAGAPDH